jgi:alginate O-acetyltransferase complex protein AlgI
VLFNSLAYAQFFALVFLISWLLVQRKLSVWVPWIAVAAVGLLNAPGITSSAAFGLRELGVVVILGLLTGFLVKQQDKRLNWRVLAGSCALNTAALAWMLRALTSSDLLSGLLMGIGAVSSPITEPSALLVPILAAVFLGAGAFAALKARRVRLLFILGASYVFYAHWDWRFLPLIFGSSSIDYLLGLKIGTTEDASSRRRWLWVTVVLNLGVLATFKYLNFGIDSARAVLSSLGYNAPELTLRVALPVGISFFTFESMSYVIDVYRRQLPPHRSYLEYLSFVAFFPHLVAGPIIRPRDLLPQLGGPPRWSPVEGSEGVFLICIGLLKKVVIGDTLALNLIDRVFDAPAQYSALECYTAVLSYAVQIYCDFSGYTDIAIGCALLLGVRFPANFHSPYKAHNIQDFWRRWHISLSTWLRDYLYIPLGGSRVGPFRTYINLMLTMLLGGLWHGANWTFVVWGGMHGVALAAHRAVAGRSNAELTTARRVVGSLLTFHFVCLAWIFFRSTSFTHAYTMLAQMSSLTTFHGNLHPKVIVALAAGLVLHFTPERLYDWCRASFTRLPTPALGLVLLVVALCLREMASAEAVPFVYFQF